MGYTHGLFYNHFCLIEEQKPLAIIIKNKLVVKEYILLVSNFLYQRQKTKAVAMLSRVFLTHEIRKSIKRNVLVYRQCDNGSLLF